MMQCRDLSRSEMDEHARSFAAQGFTIVRQMLDAASVVGWRAAAEEVLAEERGHIGSHPYHAVFFSVHRLAAGRSAFATLVQAPGIATVAARLLGGPVRIFLDQLICKPSGGRATIAHQDAPFLPLGEQPTVNCWIALCDVNEDNGALIYFPGSHLAPRLEIVHLDGPDQQLDTALYGQDGSRIPMAAGDCVFHHGNTIHASCENGSGSHRLAISIQYMLEGSVAYPPLHPFMKDVGILPGMVLDHDCFLRPTTDP